MYPAMFLLVERVTVEPVDEAANNGAWERDCRVRPEPSSSATARGRSSTARQPPLGCRVVSLSSKAPPSPRTARGGEIRLRSA